MNKARKILLILLVIFTATFSVGCFSFDFDSGYEDISLIIDGTNQIKIGDKTTLTAVLELDGPQQKVTWSSSNVSVATVDEDGVVTGVGIGTAIIIARSVENEDVIGKFTIKVLKEIIVETDDAPQQISLYAKDELVVNETTVIEYETIPNNASKDVLWTSSDESVLKVEGRGVVIATGVGTATITCVSAKNESIKATVSFTVTEKVKYTNYEDQIVKVIEESKNSILGVGNYELNQNNAFEKVSIGSGFVYKCYKVVKNEIVKTEQASEGSAVKYYYYLITNKHVVDGADKLTVYLHFIDEEVDAELLGYDTKVDMAIVGFYYDEYLKPLSLCSSSTLKAGQTVIAMGNPEGFEFSSSATSGIISYPLRYVSDDTDGDGVNDWDAEYIQHDAAINPGNSGGPLLNMYGEVIGINTMKFAATDIDNMGFSIPSDTIAELIPYLEMGEAPVRATIGIQVIAIKNLLDIDITSQEYQYKIPEGVKKGLYVTGITEGSVADKGGVLADDIIVYFNGTEIKSTLELRAEINNIIVGNNTEIEVIVLRNGKEVKLTLVF